MPQTYETGFVPKVIELEGRPYRYAVWVPPDYTPNKRWPVILFLHGKGECGDDGKFHTTVGLGRAIRNHPERFGALVVMPQIPVGQTWKGPMQTLALATLAATLKEYSVDHDRIVLTGLSLGGFGTWSLGARHPVPVLSSRQMVEAVRAAGGRIRYTEFPGVTHNSWDPAYGDPEVVAWMLAQRR
jgi:predicted peptidase